MGIGTGPNWPKYVKKETSPLDNEGGNKNDRSFNINTFSYKRRGIKNIFRFRKGKNTTTSTAIYEIDKNTYIADTPGFSTFDISEIEYRELDKYFREFKPLLENCEFVGCTHIKEENCEIKQTIKQGKIDSGRYERFSKIYEELKEKYKYKY